MTVAETKRLRARRLLTAIGIAILGGLITASGYAWVFVVAVVFTDPSDHSPWYGVPTGPGIAAFVVGSVLLLGALMTISAHARSRSGWHFIWASVWLAWVAIALNFFGFELNHDVESGIGAEIGLYSPVVALFAAAALVYGVVSLKARLPRHGDRHGDEDS